MTEPAHFGKYSKTIRELEGVIQTLVNQCDRALAEKDAEVARLRAALGEIVRGENPIQAIHANAALLNLGTEVHTLPIPSTQRDGAA